MCLLAPITLTQAAVVIHDNHGGIFKWDRTIYLGDGFPIYGTYLDIRQAPSQSGERLPGTLGNWFAVGYTGSSPGIFMLVGESEVEVAWHDGYKDYVWNGGHLSTIPLREYSDGEFVASGDRWETYGQHYLALPFSFEMDGGTPLIAPLAYLGVRIKTGPTSYNYGWILYENWTNPLMWAYETTPNTPIQIPIPAPATLTPAFTLLCLRRRRRS